MFSWGGAGGDLCAGLGKGREGIGSDRIGLGTEIDSRVVGMIVI